jgi:hypothetical protein
MHLPALALQKAVYAALVANGATGALISHRIYDTASRAAAFPYVSFGDGMVRDWSTGTEEGAEHRLVPHAWSCERGEKERGRSSRCCGRRCTMPRSTSMVTRWSTSASSSPMPPDGITWHGVIRFHTR